MCLAGDLPQFWWCHDSFLATTPHVLEDNSFHILKKTTLLNARGLHEVYLFPLIFLLFNHLPMILAIYFLYCDFQGTLIPFSSDQELHVPDSPADSPEFSILLLCLDYST